MKERWKGRQMARWIVTRTYGYERSVGAAEAMMKLTGRLDEALGAMTSGNLSDCLRLRPLAIELKSPFPFFDLGDSSSTASGGGAADFLGVLLCSTKEHLFLADRHVIHRRPKRASSGLRQGPSRGAHLSHCQTNIIIEQEKQPSHLPAAH